MASLHISLASYSSYKDRNYPGSQEEYRRDMNRSGTLYVGNLSFFTTEEQIYEAFSKCGEVKRVIMGLDRNKRTPCGFAFVEYYRPEDARDCMKYLGNGCKVDDRLIRTDLDPGFRDGRQFGRGRHGGQVRDEYREDFDEGRGGYGARMRGTAYDTTEVPTGAQQYSGVVAEGDASKRRMDDEDVLMEESNPRFGKRRDDGGSDDEM